MSEQIQKNTQQRRGLSIAGVFLIAIGVNFIMSLVLGVRTGAWQQFARGGFVLAFGVATIVAIRWIRGGRTEAGIWLIISGFLVSIIGTAVFLAGFGLALGLIAVLIVYFVALLALPPEKVKWAIGLAFIAAIIMYSLDLLALDYRIPAPPVITKALPVIAGLVILVFIIIMLRGAWSGTIRVKLLTVISLILVVTIFYQTGVILRTLREASEATEHQKITSLYDDYNDEIETQIISSAALSDSFADREDIKIQLLAGNRDGLLSLLTPIFDTLKTEYNIRHLYIENPDGTVFVRIHNPSKYGDDVTYRLTVAAALENQETVSGVEIGPNRIGIRSVSPLWQEDKFAGMLEVGLDYDQAFTDRLKQRNGADYNLWISYAAADTPGLTPEDGAPTAPIDQVFYYAGTNPLPLPIEKEVYEQVLASGELVTENVSINDQDWAVIIAPMLGYGDRVIGIVEILTSRDEVLAAINQNRITLLIPATLLTLVGLAVLWFVINQVVLKPVGHLASVAGQQIEGDLSARVEMFPADEFGDLGKTFNSLSEQLDTTLRTQEQIIASRTQALETSTEVSRRLSTILDQEQLVREVVEQLRTGFSYYHAHIYLYDEFKQNLVMVGGTGDAGRAMLSLNHKLKKGQGLVGQAAEHNQVVLIPDIEQSEGWLPNPLLPETKAELAVPIAIGGEVLGVLDVQHNITDGLSGQDADLIQAIANQVAIAVQNAQAYTRSQRQAIREAQITAISQRIQSAGSIDDVLKIAVSELGQALGAHHALVDLKVAPKTAVHTEGEQNKRMF